MKETKKQPIIGIVTCFDDGYRLPLSSSSLYIRRDYSRAIASVGAVPVLLNPDMPIDYIVELCDGVVISGGEDIEPEIYGGAPNLYPKEPSERTLWEFELLKKCDKFKLPVLGVCYGMQLLAVNYGGAIHQDIETEVPECINHNNTTHKVIFTEDFLGYSQGEQAVVNSRHHQAVASLPDGFVACAESSDGVIEAMKGRGHFGVQWHSEADETSRHIYRTFVDYCQKTASG